MEKGSLDGLEKTKLKLCRACGLPLEDKSSKEDEEQGCKVCSVDDKIEPDFISIVSALTKAVFMEKSGFTDIDTALEQAWQFVAELPYWNDHKEKIRDLEVFRTKLNLESFDINDRWLSSEIYWKVLESEDSTLTVNRYDVFISHSWDDKIDTTLVEPLINALRGRGYTIWYDKEQGLDPGDLHNYLNQAISNSDNCIPIVCKKYFKGANTCFELETLFQSKETTHIIPVWWEDVSKKFLEIQNICGEDVLKCTGVAWERYKGDIEILTNVLDEYLIAIQGFKVFNGTKLYESEANAMQDLQKVLGDKIESLEDNSTQSLQQFGFIHKNMHIVEITASHTGSGQNRKPLTLPDSFIKLKHLQSLSIPLVSIPKWIGRLSNLINLDIHGGMVDNLPEEIVALDKLESINLIGNPLNNLKGKLVWTFLEKLVKKTGSYPNLSPNDAAVLYILQSHCNWNEPIPCVEMDGDDLFCFVPQGGKIIELRLFSKGISSLPNSIGYLKSLNTLRLDSNNITFLPDGICNLESIESIDLKFNQLTSLPENIGNLASLKKLILYYNKLTSLPNGICSLKSLEILDLGHNNLTLLPEMIDSLTSLRELILNKNKWLSFPESINNLNSLKKLEINECGMHSIPENIKKLKEKGCYISHRY